MSFLLGFVLAVLLSRTSLSVTATATATAAAMATLVGSSSRKNILRHERLILNRVVRGIFLVWQSERS